MCFFKNEGLVFFYFVQRAKIGSAIKDEMSSADRNFSNEILMRRALRYYSLLMKGRSSIRRNGFDNANTITSYTHEREEGRNEGGKCKKEGRKDGGKGKKERRKYGKTGRREHHLDFGGDLLLPRERWKEENKVTSLELSGDLRLSRNLG